ncbi:hypothetical protein CRYUN_Cryun12cG0037100 [Craigia yunnanensis]
MATTTLLYFPRPISKRTHSTPTPHKHVILQNPRPLTRKLSTRGLIWNPKPVFGILGSFTSLALAGSASASELPPLLLGTSLPLNEPANALSLPTWAIHVSSVVEWYLYLVEHFVQAHGISFTILNLLRYWWLFRLH